jgi:uncharacterized protein (TIGR02246 family)
MLKPNVNVLSFMLALFLAGCNPPANAPDTKADEASLRDNEAAWTKEMDGKDLEKCAAHYADDAILMAPGMPATKGKDAIRKSLQELFADPNFKLNFATQKVDVSGSGDLAATTGTYTMTMSDPKTKQPFQDKGNYVTVYRKLGGSWKAVSDINTSETLPALSPAPAPNK